MDLSYFSEPRHLNSKSPHWREITAWSREGLLRLDWSQSLNRKLRPDRDPVRCVVTLTDAGRERIAQDAASDAVSKKQVA